MCVDERRHILHYAMRYDPFLFSRKIFGRISAERNIIAQKDPFKIPFCVINLTETKEEQARPKSCLFQEIVNPCFTSRGRNDPPLFFQQKRNAITIGASFRTGIYLFPHGVYVLNDHTGQPVNAVIQQGGTHGNGWAGQNCIGVFAQIE